MSFALLAKVDFSPVAAAKAWLNVPGAGGQLGNAHAEISYSQLAREAAAREAAAREAAARNSARDA